MEAFAFIGLAAGIVPLGLILLVIVAVTGGRNEPDPASERPAALYYAGVMFVTVFTVLFAVFTVVASLLNLTTDDGFSSGRFSAVGESIEVRGPDGEAEFRDTPSVSQFDSDDNSEDDADWANAVRALIVGGVAAGVYAFHDQRRRRRRDGLVTARVRRTYNYAVSFVSVIIAVIAGVVALYAVFKLVAPGVTSAGTRGQAGVELAQNAVLALLAGGLFLWHLRDAEPDAGAVGIAPPEPPPPPPPVDLEPTPAPRKRRTAPLKAQGR